MDLQTIYLRVPPDVKTAVEEAAREEGVSLNEFAVRALIEATTDATPLAEPPFSMELTLRVLTARALERKRITYGDLAKAHGRDDWNRAKRPLFAHLYDVGRECERRRWPMLTALVVNKASEKPSGGLRKLAEQIGRRVDDFESFVAEEQTRAFEWASMRLSERELTDDPWSRLAGSWQGPPPGELIAWTRGDPDETAEASR